MTNRQRGLGRTTGAGDRKFYHDDARLHKLCHDGDLNQVKKFVEKLDEDALAEKLASRKGVFGYTPLHEAVASGKAEVFDYVLKRAGNAHVNCRANGGCTPLHLAASCGHRDCVNILLEHGADTAMIDEHGKTPKQTAELSSKRSIVRLLQSEGKRMHCIYACRNSCCLDIQFTPTFWYVVVAFILGHYICA